LSCRYHPVIEEPAAPLFKKEKMDPWDEYEEAYSDLIEKELTYFAILANTKIEDCIEV